MPRLLMILLALAGLAAGQLPDEMTPDPHTGIWYGYDYAVNRWYYQDPGSGVVWSHDPATGLWYYTDWTGESRCYNPLTGDFEGWGGVEAEEQTPAALSVLAVIRQGEAAGYYQLENAVSGP